MTKTNRKKRIWPADKPIPKFKSYAEELRFWDRYDFEDGPAEAWELVERAAARTHVYRVRLDDREMEKLKQLARRRGVTAAVILRELVRNAS
jgi:hypothetical protein